MAKETKRERTEFDGINKTVKGWFDDKLPGKGTGASNVEICAVVDFSGLTPDQIAQCVWNSLKVHQIRPWLHKNLQLRSDFAENGTWDDPCEINAAEVWAADKSMGNALELKQYKENELKVINLNTRALMKFADMEQSEAEALAIAAMKDPIKMKEIEEILDL